ncbi:xanthine dehydrogenase family protein subunit M [Georgenia sp. SYP-B2076]|uniref:FAD binding domain-containing protein n=1 Tax=Georgenia sp. SYP-B2076 TaxID=2495881 RepID=UPI000F8E6EB0|nr:FAD binding domain-containing protein [Georgenia sp. SYP-B2076]
MKPAPFRYLRARTVEEALEALQDPGAKALAGGQNLLTLMNMRLARPELVVDLGGLRELRRSFDDDGQVILGALLTHRDLIEHPTLADRHPVLPEMASHIGHVAIRNRGTLGGALAHADPAGELPSAMVLLGAQVHADSLERGRRTIPAEDLFEAHYETVLEHDELITWVSVPDRGPRQGWGFVEHAHRHGDYAIAGAAVLVGTDADGRAQSVRASLLSAGETPVLVEATGRDLPDRDWEPWARSVTADLEPGVDDVDHVRDVAAGALAQAAAQAHARALAELKEQS